MPSGSKKRRALRKREAAAAAAAAAREKNENEATPTDTSKENSPVMRTESTDGVTAVFDEPSVVLSKRTVLPEKMLAFEGLEKRKETEEGIKENALPTEIHSSDQSSNVAEPLETSQADKIDVVVESSVVATPCVIKLDSQDKDGGSIMATDVCDFEGKEIYSSVLVSKFHDATEHLQADDVGSIMATNVCDFEEKESKVMLKNAETNTVPTDATEHLQADNVGSIMASDDADAVKSLTTEPKDFDLNAAESLNAEDAANVDAEEDQRALEHKEDNVVEKKHNMVTPENRVDVENQETAALEEDAPGKTEKAFQLGEVEAAVHNKEDAISDDVKEIEIDTLKAAVENQVKAAPNKVDASEKIYAVEVEEVETAAKNQEDDISWDVSVIGKNTLEAAAEDQLTAAPKEVDAPEKTEAAVPVDVEAVIAAKPAVDIICQTQAAELVTPEVGKQLKEIKDLVEDVLNRLNAIDALLHRN